MLATQTTTRLCINVTSLQKRRHQCAALQGHMLITGIKALLYPRGTLGRPRAFDEVSLGEKRLLCEPATDEPGDFLFVCLF